MSEAPPRRTIAQPPHSGGQRFKGLRSLLDPSQIPSAVAQAAEDQAKWLNRTFNTCEPDMDVPLSGTDCLMVDQGNATPRFIRLSTYAIPASHDLATACNVPLGFILQPFAEQPPEEEPVPLAEFDGAAPPRCGSCGAYINPWAMWSASGQSWVCNLCEATTPVSPEYFSPIDHSGRRTDHYSRTELSRGTIDFAVPSEYHANQPRPRLLPLYAPSPDTPQHRAANDPEPRTPVPLHVLFLIDVSASNSVLPSICQSIRQTLYGASPNEPWNLVNAAVQVAIMTFDGALHFYDLSHGQARAAMQVVADVDEVFVPTRSGLFADPQLSRDVIEGLLDTIPIMFSQAPSPHSAMCAGIQGALAALARTGGHILAFQSTLPNFGPGILQPRNERELYSTSKERTLWEPQEVVWNELAVECADSGVGVSLWVFPSSPVDIGTIGAVASVTGGDIFFHPRYHPQRDDPVLYSEVKRTLLRQSGYNCSIRIRCSNGLHVSSYLSRLHQPTAETLTTGILSADTSISGLLALSGRGLGSGGHIDDRKDCYIQAAVLYTSVEGERRVRVCNIGVRPSTLAGNVFKLADQDAGVCLLAKEAALSMSGKMLSEVRETLTQRYVELLVSYRKNCAAASAPTQLILPESFKLIPALGGAIIKTQALKGGTVAADSRAVSQHRILSFGVASLMNYMYPRITPVHILPADVAFPDPATGKLVLPSMIPASYLWMEPDGAYLLDNGEMTILWLGGSVSPQILIDLFDVDDWEDLGPAVYRLPDLQTQLSIQVRNLIAYQETRRGGRVVPFLLARQNLDAAELEFGNLLVEDQNNDAMSYVDYLCHLHRQISDALTKPLSWNPW